MMKLKEMESREMTVKELQDTLIALIKDHNNLIDLVNKKQDKQIRYF